MNNKGQVLIPFVITIPIIVLLFIYLASKCYFNYEKKELKSIGKILCNYSINDKTDNELSDLAKKNDEDINILVNRDNRNIEIILYKEVNYLFKDYKVKEVITCKK